MRHPVEPVGNPLQRQPLGPDLRQDRQEVGASIDPRGNGSLFFQRTEHSWHGVRPLECPPEKLRRLFIATINMQTWQVIWRRIRGKDPDGYRIRALKRAG